MEGLLRWGIRCVGHPEEIPSQPCNSNSKNGKEKEWAKPLSNKQQQAIQPPVPCFFFNNNNRFISNYSLLWHNYNTSLKYKNKLHLIRLSALTFLNTLLSGTVYGDIFVELDQVGDIISTSKEYGTTFVDAGWDNVENTSGAGRSSASSLGKYSRLVKATITPPPSLSLREKPTLTCSVKYAIGNAS